ITVNGTASGPVANLTAQGSGPTNSWTLSSHVVTNSGHIPSSAQLAAFLHQYCPTVGLSPGGPPAGPGIAGGGGPQACTNQPATMSRLFVSYQPASRYWTFQWLETGIFIALALAAAMGSYWWVTGRTQ